LEIEMTLALTLNIIFAAVTFAVVLGGIGWAIATQHRAHVSTAVAVVRPRRQALADGRRRASQRRTREAHAIQ